MNRLLQTCGTYILFWSLVSCASRKIPVKTVEMPGITISAASPVNKYRETKERYWDIIHTDASLSFNLKRKTADGTAIIRLHPYAYMQNSLVLDAKSMIIHHVAQQNADDTLKYDYRNDSLIIRFNRNVLPSDTISVIVRYTATPYENPTGGNAAISDDRGLYFINTDHAVPNKPVQIWTQGETEANSHWLPTLDQPNERLTFTLALSVPDSFTTLSNGVLKSSRPSGDGLRKDVWQMDDPIQPYAIMFAIGRYVITRDKTWNGKEVTYYTEPSYAPYAKDIFHNTPDMIDYFSKITGVPYPWNKYSQVIVRDYVSGAMENTTASLFGEFVNRNSRELADDDNEDVVSHELFHQWFGDFVTAESWSNITLNESFANYGEQLWRGHRYGQDQGDEIAYENLNSYIASARNDDPPLVRYYYDNDGEMFDRVSYQKGGAILRYMHGLMGNSAFSNAMKIYLTRNALQPAEASDWRKAVEEATGQDWNPFFTQWYTRGGHAMLDITYSYNDTAKILTVTTTQKGEDSSFAYRLPLKALMINANGKEEVDWLVSKKTSSVSYPYQNGTRPVFVPDARHWLVGTLHDNKTAPQWLKQLQMASDYIAKEIALDGLGAGGSDSLVKIGLRLALKDKNASIRTSALNRLQKKSGNAWTMPFKQDIILMAMQDDNNKVRATAFDVLGKWRVSESKDEMTTAISDSSYLVAGSALRGLQRMDSNAALSYARQAIKLRPKSRLHEAAWEIVANKGDTADISAFENEAKQLYGTRKTAFAATLKRYAQNTEDQIAFNKAVRAITDMTLQESIKGYRLTIGSHLWQLSTQYKKGIKNTDKQRQEMLDAMKQEILQAEPDQDNLEHYKSLE